MSEQQIGIPYASPVVVDGTYGVQCPACPTVILTGFGADEDETTKGVSAVYAEHYRSEHEAHDCDEFAVPYTSDGPLGHGWECGRCGRFLQAG